MEQTGAIGFLVKTYPKLSETFILGEILGLERQGLRLAIFALQQPTDELFHAEFAEVLAPFSYLPSGAQHERLTIFRTHLRCLLRAPRRYFGALFFVLRRPEAERLRDFMQAGVLAERLLAAGIKHLHAHFVNRPTAVAELAHKLSGIGYSISAHAKDIYLSRPEVLRRKIMGARFTVTCTEYNRAHLAAIAGKRANIFRLYHGIDSQRFQPGSAPQRAQPPLLLSVGRLREKKGFPTLIEACAHLVRKGVRLRCEIVGYGPEYASLQVLIQQYELSETVKLIDVLTHADLIKRYRQAALFVLACQIGEDGDRDGIPNVLLEAMAMQLPVLSTGVSGIPEVIQHGKNGLLTPSKDSAALADAIEQVLTQPEYGAQLGQAARLTVTQHFSNEINLKQLREWLLTASAAAPAAAPELGEELYG